MEKEKITYKHIRQPQSSVVYVPQWVSSPTVKDLRKYKNYKSVIPFLDLNHLKKEHIKICRNFIAIILYIIIIIICGLLNLCYFFEMARRSTQSYGFFSPQKRSSRISFGVHVRE